MPFNANILVVDADVTRRRQLVEKLGENAYRAIPVVNTHDAELAIESNSPDMVIIEFGGGEENALTLAQASALALALKKKSRIERLITVFVGKLPENLDPAVILAAGADEFLQRPINDHLLLRCLIGFVRLSTMQTEFRHRLETNVDFGIESAEDESADFHVENMRVLLVGKSEDQIRRIENILGDWVKFVCVWSSSSALSQLKDLKFDACIVLADCESIDYLNFCQDVRRFAPLYHLPVLAVGETSSLGDNIEVWKAGYTDVLPGRINGPLLFARLMALVAQEHYRRSLTAAYAAAPDTKVRDALTGLYSFGFFHAHLQREVAYANEGDKNLSVAFWTVVDMTSVNQTHGYPAGDHILRQIGGTIGRLLRGEDLVARYGGDEFCVILPGTTCDSAQIVLRRLNSIIENTHFSAPNSAGPVEIGLRSAAVALEPGETAEALVYRARALAVSYAKIRASGSSAR
jgi:two-component system cell cycle response regulator